MNKYTHMGTGTGNGERGHRAARRLANMQARHLARLAEGLARYRARKLEALGNRPADESAIEEFSAIYHAELVTAHAATGVIPQISRLFVEPAPYAAPVREAWREALMRAARACRAELYRRHRIADETASMADLVQLREVWAGNWGEGRFCEVAENHRMTAGRGTGPDAVRVSAARRRQIVDALTVAWVSGGSRKWRAGLAADIARVNEGIRALRGGAAELRACEDWHGGGTRKALDRLRERIAEGLAIIERNPAAAAVTLRTVRTLEAGTGDAIRAREDAARKAAKDVRTRAREERAALAAVVEVSAI